MRFLKYVNTSIGIRIKYPSNWEVKEAEKIIRISFFSPLVGPSDRYKENLIITIPSYSEHSKSLKKYTKYTFNQLPLHIKKFKIIEPVLACKLANLPAKKLVFTGKLRRLKLQMMQIWTVKKDRAFVIMFTSEITKYNKFLEIINEMIESFEIL